jgi:hypothetical protein
MIIGFWLLRCRGSGGAESTEPSECATLAGSHAETISAR